MCNWLALIMVIPVFFNLTELSPASTRNKHMVLPMDLTETDKHANLAAMVTRKFGKVGLFLH